MKRRLALFVVLTALFTAVFAFAQPRRHGHPPAHAKDAAASAAPEAPDAAAPLSARAEEPSPREKKEKERDGGVLEAKTLDGGARTFKFGEVEIEGRLRSPQLVYFLRRVRAEFAAGDLGHRSFLRELSETRKDPTF